MGFFIKRGDGTVTIFHQTCRHFRTTWQPLLPGGETMLLSREEVELGGENPAFFLSFFSTRSPDRAHLIPEALWLLRSKHPVAQWLGTGAGAGAGCLPQSSTLVFLVHGCQRPDDAVS